MILKLGRLTDIGCQMGRSVDGDGHPRLPRKDARAIVKFLLPRIDLKGEKKMRGFETNEGLRAVAWANRSGDDLG